MHVMAGVSGGNSIEQEGLGYTALADTGIELNYDALRNVDDAYRYNVEEQAEGFSFQSVSEGSWLAVFELCLYSCENYESDYCNWILTVYSGGVNRKK